VLFEVLFDLEGGHAAGAGGGDGLTVAAVLDVSAGEDAGEKLAIERGENVVAGDDVALGVEVDHAAEGFGVGDVADGEEHEGDGQDVRFARDLVFDAEALDVFVLDAEHLFDDGAGEELDLGMSHGAIEHDLRGAELFAAVDDGDFGGEAGEEESLFHGRVAAADDGDLFARGEEAVAGGAGGDAVADEGLFGGKVQPACTGARGDDESAGVDGLFAEVEGEGTFGEIDGAEMGEAQLCSEADGLLLHVLDEVGALDALRPAGEVFNQRGDGELASGLVAFEDEGFEVGAPCVDGGGESGAPGTEDDSVVRDVFGHISSLSVNAPASEKMQTGLLGAFGERIEAMANLTLVYGMRLLPADEIASVGEAPVTLKNGNEAHVTLHVLEGSREEIEAQLRMSIDAFFDFYPEI
jgi:hypothetical protein